MLIKTIQQQIDETDIPALQAALGDLPFPPYPYQWAAYRVCAEEVRSKNPVPFVVKASVSAGKTIMISMFCKRVAKLNADLRAKFGATFKDHEIWVASRQGEIVEQDASEMWGFNVPNSIFCAALNKKSTHYPVIVGSEKTLVNSLDGRLADKAPRFLLIDECQHVDVDDYCASEQMGKPGRFGQVIGKAEDSIAKMQAAGRTGYVILIRELQRRCRERYGKELIIIGYTGTDFRGIQPIINYNMETPGLWRKAVCDISTEYLVDFGSVVPTTFGAIDEELKYQLDSFKSDGNEGVQDFTDDMLRQMESDILAQGTLTQKIMVHVEKVTRQRNGVLVTCAGIKHCQEAANALPPGVTYGIVTQETPRVDRRRILKDAYEGKCRFVFQVGALTTGVNIPPWDTSVILRKIGSLTLLVQLLGRGMRKLKKEHETKWGMHKEDHLAMDFAGAMDDLAELYFSPMLEQYQYAVDSASGETKQCPKCGTTNGEHARRCCHVDEIGDRCDYFWVSRVCEDEEDHLGRVISGCGCENDIVARFCRKCGKQLIDPNKKLANTHYTLDDFMSVRSFKIEMAKGGGVLFNYVLFDPVKEIEFKAHEVFFPQSDNRGIKMAWKTNGLDKHVHDPKLRKSLVGKPAEVIVAQAHMFQKPIRVSHRLIDNGKKSVISRKVFFEDQAHDEF